ncbi:MAG: zinc-binding dehydrogenase [Micromonosporaceae bacterium]|jgi:NADPH:quinone reductase-like Zn-dependent oxidoreductase
MRAVRFHEYGSVDVLRLDEIPVPEPGPGEVLLKVAACGVNRVDILSREGVTPRKVPLPHTSGSEAAGTVAAVGPGVDGVEVGTRVVVNPTLSCGRCTPCREGRDNVCRYGRVFGVETTGAYADYALAPASQVIALPDTVPFRAAASVAVTGSTAWHMLVTRGAVAPGEDVLIVAGGSGIGVMGVQIAKLAGARVLATAGSAEKRERLRDLGADVVIDHTQPDWGRQVRHATGGKGADLVFEHVGTATWEQSLQALARNGRLVTCGAHSGSTVSFDLWHLFVKEQTLIGSFAGTRRDLERVLALVAAGRLRPVIHATFPLAEAPRAQIALEDRTVFGKVLLTDEERRDGEEGSVRQ